MRSIEDVPGAVVLLNGTETTPQKNTVAYNEPVHTRHRKEVHFVFMSITDRINFKQTCIIVRVRAGQMTLCLSDTHLSRCMMCSPLMSPDR